MNCNDIIKTVLYISRFCKEEGVTRPMHVINAELCCRLIASCRKLVYLDCDGGDIHDNGERTDIVEQMLSMLNCIRAAEITNHERGILWQYVHRLSEVDMQRVDRGSPEDGIEIPF